MTSETTAENRRPGVRPAAVDRTGAGPLALKSLALPSEHGGWGLLLEPLALALWLAYSSAGLAAAIAGVGAFLARHPLRLALADWQRGTRYPRTLVCAGLALGYLGVSATALVYALPRAPRATWSPLLLAAPLGLVQLVFDARLRGRSLWPELCGAAALSAGAPVVVLAGGWQLGPATVLWALLSGRAIGSVLYVRSRLRSARGLASASWPAHVCHAAVLLVALGGALAGVSPWLGVAAFAWLAARAWHGLRAGTVPVRPKSLGFQELRYGLLTLALLVLGYRWGL